jgi:hypothetical protein
MPRSSHQSACLQHRPPARGIKGGSFRFEVPAGGSGLALYAINPNETGIVLDRVIIEVLLTNTTHTHAHAREHTRTHSSPRVLAVAG